MDAEPTCNMLRPELEREVNHLRKQLEYSVAALCKADRMIIELEGGCCRFNCRTGKRNFARGCEWALGFLPDGWEEAYKELKEREDGHDRNVQASGREEG
jgi:hypothetical protein